MSDLVQTVFGLQNHQFAAILIFCISFVGTIANTIVATSTHNLPSMQNSFGLLMTSQSTGEAVHCAIFAFYFAPMVFFQNDAMAAVSQKFGLIELICYDICIFSHLCIALNRMCAICFPWKYDKYFSHRHTKIFIVISWIVSLVRCLISYGYEDCDFVYDKNIWAFVFTETKVCTFISTYLDFYKDLTVVIIIGVVDVITVAKVHMSSIQLRNAGQPVDNRRKKEINFLKQAVLQGLIFMIELYTYFHLAWQLENIWAVWVCTTVAWTLVHSTDGLIIIVFNKEFRKLVSSPKQIFRSAIHDTRSSVLDRHIDKQQA